MWFEKLDFEDNPFEDKENTSLIGYEDIIDEVLYRIASSNIVFIEGKEGSGKTALLKKAINNFKGRGRVAYLDCRELADVNIEGALISRYGFLGALFGIMPKDMIVLMDDIQSLSRKNCERIKYFYDQNYIKSIVFTGDNFNNINFTESFKDRISKVIKLKKLDENDAVDIIASRLEKNNILDDSVVKKIFSRSKNIKEFLKNCERLCEYAVENNSNKVLNEHIDTLLGKKEVKKTEEKKEKKVKAKKKEKQGVKEEKSKKEETKKLGGEEIKIIYEDVAEKYY